MQTSGFQPLRMPGDLGAVSNGSAVGSHKSCKRIKLFTVGLGLLDRVYMGKTWDLREEQIKKHGETLAYNLSWSLG